MDTPPLSKEDLVTLEYRQKICLLAAKAFGLSKDRMDKYVDGDACPNIVEVNTLGEDCRRVTAQKKRTQSSIENSTFELPSITVAHHVVEIHPGFVPFNLFRSMRDQTVNSKRARINDETHSEEMQAKTPPSSKSGDHAHLTSNHVFPCCGDCGAALQAGLDGTTVRLESASCLVGRAMSDKKEVTATGATATTRLTKQQRRRFARKVAHALKKHNHWLQRQLLLNRQNQQPNQLAKRFESDSFVENIHRHFNIKPQSNIAKFTKGRHHQKVADPLYKNHLKIQCGACGHQNVAPGIQRTEKIMMDSSKPIFKMKAASFVNKDATDGNAKKSVNEITNKNQEIGNDFIPLGDTQTPGKKKREAATTLRYLSDRSNKKKKTTLQSFLSSLNDDLW